MGRNFATPEDVTEDDLEAELDLLGDELEEEDDEEVPSYLLPSNPTGALKKDDQEAEAALAGL